MKLFKIYIVLSLSILIISCNSEHISASDETAEQIADIDTDTATLSHVDTTNYDNLYKLVLHNPDSISNISNRLIRNFPESPAPLVLKLLASYEKKEYDSCLADIKAIQILLKKQYNIDAAGKVLEPVIHKINCEKEYRSSCKDTFDIVNYFTKSRTEVRAK